MKSVGWYLTSKESTFAGTYNMRAPKVTPSPQMQKEGENQIHNSTPTGKYRYNNSRIAETSTNALETNEPKEKGHKGKGSVSIAPHEGSKDHTGQQGGITNDAQGTTDGENKVEENI